MWICIPEYETEMETWINLDLVRFVEIGDDLTVIYFGGEKGEQVAIACTGNRATAVLQQFRSAISKASPPPASAS